MRYWIVLLTICSLLSLPFSGNLAADSAHHSNAMQSAPENEQHIAADDVEDCPMSTPLNEVAEDCCDDTANTAECGKCPPDCGHCAMSDHCSTAALSMQQTLTQAVLSTPVIGIASFYQLLSGQPTPPPIIS